MFYEGQLHFDTILLIILDTLSPLMIQHFLKLFCKNNLAGALRDMRLRGGPQNASWGNSGSLCGSNSESCVGGAHRILQKRRVVTSRASSHQKQRF